MGLSIKYTETHSPRQGSIEPGKTPTLRKPKSPVGKLSYPRCGRHLTIVVRTSLYWLRVSGKGWGLRVGWDPQENCQEMPARRGLRSHAPDKHSNAYPHRCYCSRSNNHLGQSSRVASHKARRLKYILEDVEYLPADRLCSPFTSDASQHIERLPTRRQMCFNPSNNVFQHHATHKISSKYNTLPTHWATLHRCLVRTSRPLLSQKHDKGDSYILLCFYRLGRLEERPILRTATPGLCPKRMPFSSL